MPSSHDHLAGRYRLIESLGEGGMGRIWLARDHLLDRDVAIKEILFPLGLTGTTRDELWLRTLRGARAAAQISHPNVVRIHDVFRTDGRFWIVMEHVPSRSLHDVIIDQGPLPPELTALIGLSILDGLNAAHRSGVLHRDVKPGNVLIASDGRVMLTDFGVATFDGQTAAITRPGVVIGSPGYIAPERAMVGRSGPESDLWSLGATLYATVEGHSPFSRTSTVATLTALVSEQPDRMRRAGPLKPVLRGLLRKDPEKRMGAAEAGQRLRRVARSAGGSRARRLFAPLGPPARVNVAPEATAPGRRAILNVQAPAVAEAGRQRPGGSRRAHRLLRWLAAGAVGVTSIGLSSVLVRNTAGVGADSVVRAPSAGWSTPATTPLAATPPATPPPAATPPATTPPGTDKAPLDVPPAQPGGARVPDLEAVGHRLPPGWAWHDEPGVFRVAIPENWAPVRTGSMVYFREPGGDRMLAVGRWRPLRPDPVAAWTAEEADAVGTAGYRRVRIDPVPHYFQACADWEYSHEENGGRLRTLHRGFSPGPGRSYVIMWRTREADWQVNQAHLWLFMASFRAF